MKWLLILFCLSVPIQAETPHPETQYPEKGALATAIEHVHEQAFEAAEALLLDVQKAEPDNAEAAFYLGRVYLAQGRAQAAVQALETATRFDPASSAYQFSLAEALVARIDEVAVLFKLGVANRMRVAYEKAVELDPENLEARVAVARYHSEAPAIAGGNATKAQQQLDEIRLRDPALAHVTQALIHERLGRLEPAEEELAAAVDADPDSVVSWREAGLFYQRRERPWDAQRAFDEVLTRRPDDPVALFAASQIAMTLSEQQLARAERALHTYLRLEPGPLPIGFSDGEVPPRAVAHQRLGRVYERQGRPDLAARELDMASESGALDPERRIDFPLVDAAWAD